MILVTEINRTISASLDLDNTLNSILKSIRSVIPYDHAEINLWSAPDGVLVTRVRSGNALLMPDIDRPGRYRLGEGYTGWIAQQRQPLLIADTMGANRPAPEGANCPAPEGDNRPAPVPTDSSQQASPAVRPILPVEQFPAKSICGVPLLSGDELIGTLELAALAPGAFTSDTVGTLCTIAAQAAVAIQNAQLFAETRRRVDESAALFRISTIAASALTPDELLRQLMAAIGQFMRADSGLALVFNAKTRCLEPLTPASFGDLPAGVSDFRIDTTRATFHYSVFKTRMVFRTADGLNDRRVPILYRPFIERYQVRALLAAPLVIRDEAIGEVYMANHTTAAFTAEDEQRLTTVLALLADAIFNARLSAERERRLKQLSLLSEIGRAISSALHESEVLALLYPQINRVIERHARCSSRCTIKIAVSSPLRICMKTASNWNCRPISERSRTATR